MSTSPAPTSEVTSAQEAARTSSRWRELVPALAGVALGVTTLALSTQIPDGAASVRFSPRWWPDALAFLLIGLGVVHAVLSWVTGGTDEAPEPATRAGAIRLVAILSAIVGYGVLWYFVDFRVSTTVLFVALTYIAGGRGWKALLLFPVVTTMVLYLLFGVLLRVPL
ncbi:tripartite tricarboxylate transporter TctB family protein [Marinactinospora thermotolerans]|uniref:Tripartite tricarboxylate transporter TctB family protein n=1 Tax=Marinactinospora thermotolerans DSM 45154 TaxID=1122192 RepID=A0A1T4K7F1_9ACTN|nr:tripartite tricarboxylate transporter TctB family protein [Marinactinospora thermotolerans]SJZ38243.1 Tripartite tricarboxylate transporter TctB family protein [Marinactinospora thermotolerans DSM 45154]